VYACDDRSVIGRLGLALVGVVGLGRGVSPTIELGVEAAGMLTPWSV